MNEFDEIFLKIYDSMAKDNERMQNLIAELDKNNKYLKEVLDDILANSNK